MRDFKIQPAGDLGVRLDQRPVALNREPGHIAHLIQSAASLGVKAYLRVWHRYSVHGREYLPQDPPFVMIANHSSHLDALALAAVMPARQRSRVYPLAASDTFFANTPSAALSALLLNALPVHRRRCVHYTLTSLRERIVGGHSILILFPEGTRSRTGACGTFKAGLGRVVCGLPVPVVPCWIDGASTACPPGTRLPRRMPVRVIVGPSFTLAHVSDDREGWETASHRAHAAVLALRPDRDVPPPGLSTRIQSEP